MATSPLEFLQQGEAALDDLQRAWLRPLGVFGGALRAVMYGVNSCCIRLAFRFRVQGREWIPQQPPVIFAANHESRLDGPLLAAALPYRIAKHTSAAGRRQKVLASAPRRLCNRLAQTVPISRDISALAAGAAVLQRGRNLIWFPEGTRSRDGSLQQFKFGVGALARHCCVPIVPVGIDGAYEAFPPGAKLPRLFVPITVRFGSPLWPDALETSPDDAEADRELAQILRRRVNRLR